MSNQRKSSSESARRGTPSPGTPAGRPRAAAQPRKYSTPLIAERRKRILDETKKLIGEVGIDGFTLRELGQRAGVSVTTVYNTFGDKEGVIAHALREFHAGIKLNLPSHGANLAGYCRTICDTTDVVIENRAYALALADLYFSRSLTPTLFDVIRSMPLQVFLHWLWMAERDGLLNGLISSADAEAAFANLEWSCVKDWGAGRITDESLAHVRQRSFLIMVKAVATRAIADTADALLETLVVSHPGADSA